MSGECLAERDMQHGIKDHFLWEVVDIPDNPERLFADGEMGELVLTRLTSRQFQFCAIARMT